MAGPFPSKPVVGVIAVLASVFNATLCLVILRKPRMLRKSYHFLIFSLAITDTLTGIFLFVSPNFVMDSDIFSPPAGLAGQFFCRLIDRGYFVFLFGKFSIMLVTCMAVERWFAIARPIRYKVLFTRRRVMFYTLALFAWCVPWTFPGLFESSMEMINSKPTCVMREVIADKYLSRIWVIGYGVVTLLIPLLFVCGTFLHLRFVVRKRINATAGVDVRHQASIEIKLSRMSVAVALVMAVCFLPLQTMYALMKFGVATFTSPIFLFTLCLAMVNSCLNPWIYCFTNRTYRKEFAHLLCSCRHRPQTLDELSASTGACVVMKSVSVNREDPDAETNQAIVNNAI